VSLHNVDFIIPCVGLFTGHQRPALTEGLSRRQLQQLA